MWNSEETVSETMRRVYVEERTYCMWNTVEIVCGSLKLLGDSNVIRISHARRMVGVVVNKLIRHLKKMTAEPLDCLLFSSPTASPFRHTIVARPSIWEPLVYSIFL